MAVITITMVMVMHVALSYWGFIDFRVGTPRGENEIRGHAAREARPL